MSSVAAPSDRRFRRAHVKPGRKRARAAAIARPVLKVIVLAVLSIYAAYRGGSVVTHARVLQIDDIVIRAPLSLALPSHPEVLRRIWHRA